MVKRWWVDPARITGVNPVTLWNLLFEPTFIAGVLAALVAGLILLLLQRVRPDWGVGWVAAAGAGVWYSGFWRVGMGDRVSEAALDWWPAVVVAAVAGAVGLHQGRKRPGLPLAVGLTVGGVWATVPDTELARVMMGVTAILLWVSWPRQWVSIGVLGAALVPIALAASAVAGGVGRDSGTIGALGVIAILALYPAGRHISTWFDLGTQLVAVLAWSRIAGRADSAVAALVIGLIITAVVVAAKLSGPRWLGRRTDQSASESA